jgi:hypothetical protein
MPRVWHEVVGMTEKDLLLKDRVESLIGIYLSDEMSRQFIDTLMTWLTIAIDNEVVLKAIEYAMNNITSELMLIAYASDAKNN